MKPPTDDPRFLATFDVIRRTGAREVQVRYSDDEQPVVWFVVAGYSTREDGRPRSTGKVNTYEVGAAMHPSVAAFRLCEQLVEGGECTHCHRPSGFSEDAGVMPLDDHVCWWTWDPEVSKFVQGCTLR